MKLSVKEEKLLRKIDAHKLEGVEITTREDAKLAKSLLKHTLVRFDLNTDEHVRAYITDLGVTHIKRLPNYKL